MRCEMRPSPVAVLCAAALCATALCATALCATALCATVVFATPTTFALLGDYCYGSTPCSDGLYAGCMTAPCRRAEGASGPISKGELVTCSCPTWNGVYQVRQDEESCHLGVAEGTRHVWSAARLVGASAGTADSDDGEATSGSVPPELLRCLESSSGSE